MQNFVYEKIDVMSDQNKKFSVNGLNNFKNKMPKSINPSSKSCLLPQCSTCYWVYWIFAIVVLVIFLYWLFLVTTFGKGYEYRDFMNQKLFNVPFLENCCSSWPLSHFLLFFILGFVFPGCLILLIIAGVYGN